MVPQYLSSLQDRLQKEDWVRLLRLFADIEQEIGCLVEHQLQHGLDDLWLRDRLSTSASKSMRKHAMQCFLEQLAKNVEQLAKNNALILSFVKACFCLLQPLLIDIHIHSLVHSPT